MKHAWTNILVCFYRRRRQCVMLTNALSQQHYFFLLLWGGVVGNGHIFGVTPVAYNMGYLTIA